MAERTRIRPETAIFVAHEDFNKRDVAEAEKNLMRAILQTAMEDIRKKGEVYRDARRYFSSKDDFYLYSFLSICYHLDLCPRTIRTVIGLNEDREREPMIAVDGEKVAA
jgi:hypothetical protein